jgi:hypothetical protein
VQQEPWIDQYCPADDLPKFVHRHIEHVLANVSVCRLPCVPLSLDPPLNRRVVQAFGGVQDLVVAHLAFLIRNENSWTGELKLGVDSDELVQSALLQLMEERRARQRALLCEALQYALPDLKLQKNVWSYVDTAHPQIGKMAQLIDIAVRCLALRLIGATAPALHSLICCDE